MSGHHPAQSVEERKKREGIWTVFQGELSRVTDNFGMTIEPGVLEPVIGLNLFSVTTIQSCEGHAERGPGAPWIIVGVRESEDIIRLQKELDDAVRRLDAMEKLKSDKEELLELYAEVHRRKRAVKRPRLQVVDRGIRLLDEFYAIPRSVSHDARLMIDASGRLTNHGAHIQDVRDHHIRLAKLEEYKNEMKAFGFYLKHKYLLGV